MGGRDAHKNYTRYLAQNEPPAKGHHCHHCSSCDNYRTCIIAYSHSRGIIPGYLSHCYHLARYLPFDARGYRNNNPDESVERRADWP
jgi:hypothetical protein